MSSDLELEITDALRHRASAVTADDLRGSGTARPRPPRTLWPMLAAAAVVVAVAGGLAIALARHDSGAPSTSGGVASGSLHDAIGPGWQLVDITTPGGTEARPRNVRITFHHGGTFDADDGVNHLGGKYRISGRTIVLSGVASTAIGYAGTDRAVLLGQEAMTAFASGAPATARLDGASLVVVVKQFTMTFHAMAGSGSGAGPSAPVSATPSTTDVVGSTPSYVNGSEIAGSPGAS